MTDPSTVLTDEQEARLRTIADPCPWCGQHPAERERYTLGGHEGVIFACPNLRHDQLIAVSPEPFA